MPLISDKAAFEDSFASLPLVTKPCRYRDRRCFDNRSSANPQEGHRCNQMAEFDAEPHDIEAIMWFSQR